ncbi:UNVERIFIED_CONTAM: hypothetical protein K2H54_072942 [Gekko kuhli]
MAEHRRGKASPASLPPPCQGDANGRERKLAPGGLLRLPAGPLAGGVSALRLFRRKPPNRRGPPPKMSAAQLLPEEPDFQPPCKRLCLSPGPPRQGAPRGPSRRPPHLGPAQECPAEQTGGRCRGLPPTAVLHPLGQQPEEGASARGDLPLARWWGLLPSGFVWMSAQLDPEGGAQPVRCPPPNICILSLAMMIAGIPTVPVPGVREEDMILAAQSFMAGSPQPGEAERQRRWAAVPPQGGLSCKSDKQRRQPVAGRSLLPLFLAQLEK